MAEKSRKTSSSLFTRFCAAKFAILLQTPVKCRQLLPVPRETPCSPANHPSPSFFPQEFDSGKVFAFPFLHPKSNHGELNRQEAAYRVFNASNTTNSGSAVDAAATPKAIQNDGLWRSTRRGSPVGCLSEAMRFTMNPSRSAFVRTSAALVFVCSAIADVP